VNDTIDLFGVRKDELSGSNVGKPGDMDGARLLVNYGLLPTTTLHGEFAWRNLEMSQGLPDQDIFSWGGSVHQRLAGDDTGPSFTSEVGVRGNYASETQTTSLSGMNTYLRRVMGSAYSLRDEGSYLWFDKKSGSSTLSYGVPRAGHPIPVVTAEGNHDVTPFVRVAAGAPYGQIHTSIFAEYGHSFIDGTVDTTLTSYLVGAPAFLSGIAPKFPLDLSRQEDYLKAGATLFFTLPFRVTGGIGYEYLRMFRDSGLDAEPDNHVLKGDLTWWATERLAVGIGAAYYHRQYNGVIPFLYNRYSQSTFDHRYGHVSAGITWLFGGAKPAGTRQERPAD